MLAVIINTCAVLLGSFVGILFKKGIPERLSTAVMTAIGLVTLYIGIQGSLKSSNTIILIVSMVFGTILGTILDIDKGLSSLGKSIETKLGERRGTIAQGFVTGSLLFCVGSMTIVGSLNAGLLGDYELLYTKSALDLISSCMLSSSLGIGVMFASLFVLVFQGILVLCAGALRSLLEDPALVSEIIACGSVMIIGLGLNLLKITKFKVANFLPAMLFVPLIYYLYQVIGI